MLQLGNCSLCMKVDGMKQKHVIFRVLVGDDEVAFFAVPKEKEREFEENISLVNESMDAKCLSIFSKSKYLDNMQMYNNKIADLFDNLFSTNVDAEDNMMGNDVSEELSTEM